MLFKLLFNFCHPDSSTFYFSNLIDHLDGLLSSNFLLAHLVSCVMCFLLSNSIRTYSFNYNYCLIPFEYSDANRKLF